MASGSSGGRVVGVILEYTPVTLPPGVSVADFLDETCSSTSDCGSEGSFAFSGGSVPTSGSTPQASGGGVG